MFVIVGAVVSIVKLVTDNGVETLLVASVTVIVQSENVPSARLEKVIVLDPNVAVVVTLVQDPP